MNIHLLSVYCISENPPILNANVSAKDWGVQIFVLEIGALYVHMHKAHSCMGTWRASDAEFGESAYLLSILGRNACLYLFDVR